MVVVAFQDISRQKRVEQELERARATAEAASRAKSDFLANMSHEIRTPLGAIIGFAELLSSPLETDADKDHYLTVMKRNAHQLTSLIDDILDLTKIEASRVELERMWVTLVTTVNDVLAALSLKAQEKGLDLTLETDGQLPDRIVTDPTRFKQVISNLVTNAVKFTDQGRVQLSMKWQGPLQGNPEVQSASSSVARLEIRVRDTGVGIAASQVGRIFQTFSQADSSMTRKYGGTGLGLSLSRRLARLLGGELALEQSEPGRGSVFLFSLELKTGEFANKGETVLPGPEGALTERESVAKTPACDTPVRRALEGLKLLLVDDAPDNRLLVKTILQRAGARVELAENGLEAIEKAWKREFDAVLMDIQMPVLDGHAATLRLRQDGYTKPIIALTAHAVQEERERCLRVGCNDHLAKPVNSEMLLSAILKHCAQAP